MPDADYFFARRKRVQRRRFKRELLATANSITTAESQRHIDIPAIHRERDAGLHRGLPIPAVDADFRPICLWCIGNWM